jgi:hypothetical protein
LVCSSQRSVLKGENQIEKILLWAEVHTAVESGTCEGNGGSPMHAARIFTKSGEDYSLTAGNTTVILAPTNPRHE